MKKILVIDDDPIFRSTLNRLLSDRAWQVMESDDGEKGLALALEQRPEVVVCGLHKQGYNGYQVIRFIQGHRETLGGTRIIVTAAGSFAADRQNVLQAGADAVLIKPIIAGELFKILDSFAQTALTDRPGSEEADSQDQQTVKVKFWGVRGSLPTPGPSTVHYGGNTACVEVRADDEIIILDAGTGIRSLGIQLASEYKDKPLHLTLLMTHTHWDHIQGFPFFAPAYDPKNIVRVFSYEGARRGLEATLSIQMESPYFPITLHQMPGNITIQELKGLSFKIGKVKVEAAFVNHPGVCVGYRLFTSQGSIVYIPDNELTQRLKNKNSAVAQEGALGTPAFAPHPEQKLIEFIKGADVAILDSQYDENEYAQHIGWGHSCADDSVALAVEAKVKDFFLFHHDPSHDDAKISKMLATAREVAARLGASTRVEAAREGFGIELRKA